jgi:hypothetical protein
MGASPQLIVVFTTRNLRRATIVPVAHLQDTANLRQLISQQEGLLERKAAKDPQASKQLLEWLKLHYYVNILGGYLGETTRAVQRIFLVNLMVVVLNSEVLSFFLITAHHQQKLLSLPLLLLFHFMQGHDLCPGGVTGVGVGKFVAALKILYELLVDAENGGANVKRLFAALNKGSSGVRAHNGYPIYHVVVLVVFCALSLIYSAICLFIFTIRGCAEE